MIINRNLNNVNGLTQIYDKKMQKFIFVNCVHVLITFSVLQFFIYKEQFLGAQGYFILNTSYAF